MRDSDQPLKQDFIREIREAKSVVTKQLASAEIPIEVVHLLVFME